MFVSNNSSKSKSFLEVNQEKINWPLFLDLIDTTPVSLFFEEAVKRAITDHATLEAGVPYFHRDIVSSLFGNREIFQSEDHSSPTLDLVFVTFHAYPDLIIKSSSHNTKNIALYHKVIDNLNARMYGELNSIASDIDEQINQPELLEAFIRAAKQSRLALEISAISKPSEGLSEFFSRVKNITFGNQKFIHQYHIEELNNASSQLHKIYFKHLRESEKGKDESLSAESLIERLWLSPRSYYQTGNHLMHTYRELEDIGMSGNPSLRLAELQTTLDYAIFAFVKDNFESRISDDVLKQLIHIRERVQNSLVRSKVIKTTAAGAGEVLLSWVGKWW